MHVNSKKAVRRTESFLNGMEGTFLSRKGCTMVRSTCSLRRTQNRRGVPLRFTQSVHWLCVVDLSPFWRAEQLGPARGSRRGLFESHGKARCVCLARSSSAAALPGQAAQGHPRRGRASGAAFFWFLFLAAQEKELAAGLPPAALRLMAGSQKITSSTRATMAKHALCAAQKSHPEKQMKANQLI